MSQHYPVLIIIIPLFAALLVVLAGWLKQERFCYLISVITLGSTIYASLGLFRQVLEQKQITYQLAGWAPPIGIEYRVDLLNALVLIVITVVAFLNLIAAKKKVESEFTNKTGTFYGLYLLFVAGLSGMTITGDVFNLYVLLEITALTGYAIIGMGKKHAPLAGLHYVLMGTIGASFYLLGIGYLYMATGSLNMTDLSKIIPHIQQSNVVLFALILCLIGLFIKMALFPLHAWLPNAYSYAPTAASGLIAALTTKVMIYVMIRLVLTVFSMDFSFSNPIINQLLVWVSIAAIVSGSVLALGQRQLTRMFTYIVVAEVGYMVGGFWLTNEIGITGAILHIINDAAMTLCLFLAAGNIIYKVKEDHFENLAGLVKKMPITITALIIGGLSIVGVPPTCGFFSKWYLIRGGIDAENYAFVAALIFSSLINMILFVRIIEIVYFKPALNADQSACWLKDKNSMEEAPFSMLLPLVISAATLIILGLYTNYFVTDIIQFVKSS